MGQAWLLLTDWQTCKCSHAWAPCLPCHGKHGFKHGPAPVRILRTCTLSIHCRMRSRAGLPGQAMLQWAGAGEDLHVPVGLQRATSEDADAAPSGAVPLPDTGVEEVTSVHVDELASTLWTGGFFVPQVHACIVLLCTSSGVGMK